MEQGPANSETGEPRLGPGYRCLKEIGRGGYGYVYLFNRNAEASGEEEYVAGKFVYRQAFGPPEDGSTFAGYQRAIEGLENFRSLTSGSPRIYFGSSMCSSAMRKGISATAWSWPTIWSLGA